MKKIKPGEGIGGITVNRKLTYPDDMRFFVDYYNKKGKKLWSKNSRKEMKNNRSKSFIFSGNGGSVRIRVYMKKIRHNPGYGLDFELRRA